MDFPKLVLDDKILMDILVLALMLIAIGIAFLIYHRTENIEQSKLLLAEIILLTTAVISLFALIIIGTIFLTYHCSEHLDMPKLVLMFSILLAVVTVSLFILTPFLIYYRCCSAVASVSIDVLGPQDQEIELACRSTGWFPSPELHWVTKNGQDLQPVTKTEQDHELLFSVLSHVTILGEETGEISCVIQNSLLKTEQKSVILLSECQELKE
ncbi:unnamed protein product [Caretta caretta]